MTSVGVCEITIGVFQLVTSWYVIQDRLIHGSLLKRQWSLNSLTIVSFVEHLHVEWTLVRSLMGPGVHNQLCTWLVCSTPYVNSEQLPLMCVTLVLDCLVDTEWDNRTDSFRGFVLGSAIRELFGIVQVTKVPHPPSSGGCVWSAVHTYSTYNKPGFNIPCKLCRFVKLVFRELLHISYTEYLWNFPCLSPQA